MMEDKESVHYRIFPQFDELESEKPASVKERLEELKTQSLSIVYPIVENYIWQHEPFNLRACSFPEEFPSGKSSKSRESIHDWETEYSDSEFSSADAFVPHLFGNVSFGDNLEDEWLVVYLLLQLSLKFPTVSITVRDSDGELLLIEAAYFIPKWLKPENSHNRVFLRQGSVHFVPPSRPISRSRNSSVRISLKKSLQVLTSGAVDTKASPEVQNVILERIADYPEKAQKNVHRVRCKVSLPVAQILTHEPQMIALSVESFYSRDIDAMKAASRMEKFSPKCKDDVELVDMVVRMSKAMYAQLVQQIFQAPSSYPMPPLNSPDFKEAEIGMKIAVGFEMMYWERSQYEILDSLACQVDDEVDDVYLDGLKNQGSSGKNEEAPTTDVAWQKYKGSLEKSGYFKGLLEGSKEHRELLQAAIAQYRSTDLFARVSKAMHAPVKRITELLSMPHSVSDFSNAGLEQSDDDSWLYNGEEDLATVLMERQKEMDAYDAKQGKRRSGKTSSVGASNQESQDLECSNAAEIVRSVQSFFKKISSFEGAEIPENESNKDVADDGAVELDMGRLLKELGSVFDSKEISTMLAEGLASEDSDSSSSSSDIDLDDSASASEDEPEADVNGVAVVEDNPSSNEALDGKEKRKDEDVVFSDEYSDVLDKELKTSTLAQSFAKRRDIVSIDEPKISGAESKKAKPESGAVEKEKLDLDDMDDLVDVDANLLESLLQSYMFQQGMPGPASNMLGAMGVGLPDNADARPGSSKTPQK